MYQSLKPQVFIDNHTSNGADYQHVLTYFATQKDKLHPAVSGFMTRRFQPELDRLLAGKGFPPAPVRQSPRRHPRKWSDWLQ